MTERRAPPGRGCSSSPLRTVTEGWNAAWSRRRGRGRRSRGGSRPNLCRRLRRSSSPSLAPVRRNRSSRPAAFACSGEIAVMWIAASGKVGEFSPLETASRTLGGWLRPASGEVSRPAVGSFADLRPGSRDGGTTCGGPRPKTAASRMISDLFGGGRWCLGPRLERHHRPTGLRTSGTKIGRLISLGFPGATSHRRTRANDRLRRPFRRHSLA